jgi:D-3-phosphoglycerate dehydrogenase
MALKVLLLENIHPGARDQLIAEGFDVEMVSSALKDDELVARLAGVHVLGIRSKTQVRANVISQARDLMTIGCFCIGTNQVELASANAHGVPVFNAPFSNTRSVAELIISEVVALARQLGDRSREVHAGVWKKVATSCYEIRGKTLGIIGYGHIGRQVGVLAEMFGMRVVFFDVLTKLPMGNNQSRSTMEEVLAESDFVTLHVPETAQTKNMIGEAELAHMKPQSYLLNASRGTVVVIPALAAAIKSGHLAGAAVDVYPEEPEANGEGFQSELRGLPNVLLTPHIGGSTAEAQASIGREVATSLTKYIKGGATTGAVNFPVIEVPLEKGRGRVLNVHRNVPGVMRDVSRIVAARDANIHAQVLATDSQVGYLVMDLDAAVAPGVAEDIRALSTDIKTRVIY